ncbi:hypothetical protein [Pontibacter akesuensis]|uniref:Uncharacterized protein n=1 Tax=Pontibacter akesuensis TaxID=388950 RepID=A0A1I7JE42_9BACT|nr:hypothetical protein [Pontibacter akesuensis]GHA70608.1 hypothetical protein GCM10007389_25000 [Pontibacter akesuensis]SFU83431.1 hypothetical protein SAMN04487941_2768 [Pontibacter akesuensis]
MLLLRSESVLEPPELEELLLLLLPDLLLPDFALGLSDFFESFLEEEEEVVEPEEELFAFVPEDLEVDPEVLLLELPLGEDDPLPEEDDPPNEDPPEEELPEEDPP